VVGSCPMSTSSVSHSIHQRLYQKLVAWKEAHKLCLLTYKITSTFPKIEIYRLVDQMCRSAQSVPTNIAEGCTKKSAKHRDTFYETASTSLEELHYQYLLSRDLGYITSDQFEEVDDMIKRTSFLIMRLRSSLR
jgi:four helix bundle protein